MTEFAQAADGRTVIPDGGAFQTHWHFEPIVAALQEAGNELVRSWYPTRDGWEAKFAKPIDWTLIQERFVLPPSFAYAQQPQYTALYDKNTGSTLLGPPVN